MSRLCFSCTAPCQLFSAGCDLFSGKCFTREVTNFIFLAAVFFAVGAAASSLLFAPAVLWLAKDYANLVDVESENEGEMCSSLGVSTILSDMATVASTKRVLILLPIALFAAILYFVHLRSPSRGLAAPFIVYFVSLLEDVAAVAFIDDDPASPTSFSQSTLFIAFMVFPMLDFSLDEAATRCLPKSRCRPPSTATSQTVRAWPSASSGGSSCFSSSPRPAWSS